LAVQEDITENVRMEKRLKNAKKLEKQRIEQIERANINLQSITEKQEKTLELFSKYVPEEVIRNALSNRRNAIRKCKKIDAAVLFCDIRGFTSMVEKLGPDEVVRVLNTYYSMMAEVIKFHKGVINQFIGDEIFVSFGAPITIKEPEKSAVNCAIDMINKLEGINDNLKDILPKDISVGIGINYGPVVAGNLGSDERLSYSITGDTVNTAKRIESLTNEYSDIVLISESIHDEIDGLISTQPWGKVKFKGKAKEMNIYQVV
jgi:adenylate cyclase